MVKEDEEISGKVVDTDDILDLSLIETCPRVDKKTGLGACIPKDKKIYTYLYDRGYIRGQIIYHFEKDGHDFYVADIGGEKGDSGAGVFNKRGYLIGLVTRIFQSDKLSKKYVIFSSPVEFNRTIQRWKIRIKS